MSLKTFMISLDDKIRVIDRVIAEARRDAKVDDAIAERLPALKSIAADLEARREYPRSHALGELERILDRVLRSKTANGYDENQLNNLARHIINRWPFISQALEQFGEESAE